MAPSNRYFANTQAMTLAYEEQFRIEPETEDGQFFKSRERLLAMKEFEPALSIVNLQAEQQPDHPIKQDPAEFPEL